MLHLGWATVTELSQPCSRVSQAPVFDHCLGTWPNQACQHEKRIRGEYFQHLLSNQFISSCLGNQQRPGYLDTIELPSDMFEDLCQPTADRSKTGGRGHEAQTAAAKNGWLYSQLPKRGFTIDGIKLPLHTTNSWIELQKGLKKEWILFGAHLNLWRFLHSPLWTQKHIRPLPASGLFCWYNKKRFPKRIPSCYGICSCQHGTVTSRALRVPAQ